MSILSDARNLAVEFADGAKQIVGWAEALYAKLDPTLHAAVDAEVRIAKQALSDAISMADTAAKPVIDRAAETIETSFLNVLSGIGLTLGGPTGEAVAGVVGRQLQPYEIDAVNHARDSLKAELDVLALRAKARLAGHPATPPAT